MKIGRIPENLFIVVRPEVEHRVTVDGDEFVRQVKPAFAVDGDSENMIASAKKWGTEVNWRVKVPEEDLTLLEMPNEPFTNLLLIDLEKRSEGGCAYKVVDTEGRLYDLREDVFLECLYAGEIVRCKGQVGSPAAPQGDGVYLTGEFIWGVNGNQMRLVRVGSQLYEQLQEAGERRKMVKLNRKDLVPGTVYKMKNGEQRAYLGYKRGSGMLISELDWDKSLSFQKRLDVVLKVISYRVRYLRSHSFVEALETVEVPEDIFDRVDAYEAEQERQRREYERVRGIR